MDLEFHPLLQILLKHDYFTDGNCPAVEIVPSPTTAQLMQAMTLRMVGRKFGAELFYGKRNGRPTPLAEQTTAIRLSFWLRPNVPHFYNYTTGLSEDGRGTLFYATNRDSDTADAAAFPVSSDAAHPVESRVFVREISDMDSDIFLSDEGGNRLNEEDWISIKKTGLAPDPDMTPPPPTVSVDATKLQAGCYFFNDNDTIKPFLNGADGFRTGDVGLLSVFLGDLGSGQRAGIKADGTIEPITIEITFSARSTIWRYHLIPSTRESRDFSIKSKGTAAPKFTSPSPSTRMLPNHTEAHLLVSESPIQLRASPTERLWLTFTDEEGRKHPDAILLPNAGAESLSRDGPGGGQILSDLFVYI